MRSSSQITLSALHLHSTSPPYMTSSSTSPCLPLLKLLSTFSSFLSPSCNQIFLTFLTIFFQTFFLHLSPFLPLFLTSHLTFFSSLLQSDCKIPFSLPNTLFQPFFLPSYLLLSILMFPLPFSPKSIFFLFFKLSTFTYLYTSFPYFLFYGFLFSHLPRYSPEVFQWLLVSVILHTLQYLITIHFLLPIIYNQISCLHHILLNHLFFTLFGDWFS